MFNPHVLICRTNVTNNCSVYNISNIFLFVNTFSNIFSEQIFDFLFSSDFFSDIIRIEVRFNYETFIMKGIKEYGTRKTKRKAATDS